MITAEAQRRGAINSNTRKVIKICEVCHRKFEVPARLSHCARYCSKACRNEMAKQRYRENHPKSHYQITSEAKFRLPVYKLIPCEEWGWCQSFFAEDEIQLMLKYKTIEPGIKLVQKDKTFIVTDDGSKLVLAEVK
jgi:hypothetical protein